MNKTKQTITALLAVLVLGAGGFFLFSNNNNTENSSSNKVANETAESSMHEHSEQHELAISEDQKLISYTGEEGSTALEILKSLTEVKTESSDFGDFVTSINGVEADAGKEYWSFYVNGEYANEGAGTYKTADGEKIEWKLEQL